MHGSALESPASQLSAIDRLVNAANRLEDRRDNQRFPCFVPVEIVGGNIPAGRWFFAREISHGGIGLVHNSPLDTGEVLLLLDDEQGAPMQLRTEILWCRPCARGR